MFEYNEISWKDAVSIPTLIDNDHNKLARLLRIKTKLTCGVHSSLNALIHHCMPPLFDSDLDIILLPVFGINSGPDSSDNCSGDSLGSFDDSLLCTEEVSKLLQLIDTSRANGPEKIQGKC